MLRRAQTMAARRGTLRLRAAAPAVPTAYAFDSTFDSVLTGYREIESAAAGPYADVAAVTPTPGMTPQLLTMWATEPATAGTQTLAGTVSFSLNGYWAQGAFAASAAPALRMELHRRSGAGAETILATIDKPSPISAAYGAQTWSGTLPSAAFIENDRLICKLYLIPFGGNAMGGDYVSVDVGAGNGGTLNLPNALTVKPDPVLFASGFESATVLNAESDATSAEAYRVLSGTDAGTGGNWSAAPFGGTFRVQLLNRTGERSSTVRAGLETTTGRLGTATTAMHLELLQSVSDSQTALLINPVGAPPQELYIRSYMRQPADLLDKLINQGQNFCHLGPEIKTAGDFRVLNDAQYSGPTVRAVMTWDNNANGGLTPQQYYRNVNTTFEVPAGSWYKCEFYFLRHATAGRAWLKINDTLVHDNTGPTIGQNGAQINRIFLGNAYSGGPIDLWVDDIEIRATAP